MSAKKIDYIEGHKSSNITLVGYDASKFNALKHGVLSKYTVMHWENREDYDALHTSLILEYAPQSVTEAHLIEELAGSIWRKMRLRYAEMASLQSPLHSEVSMDSGGYDYSAQDVLLANSQEVEDFDIEKTVTSSAQDTQEVLIEAKKYLEQLLIAEQNLSKTTSYNKGLAALDKDMQDEWQNEWLGSKMGEGSMVYTANVESLRLYIEKSKQRQESYIYELENRDKVKTQILGKSFFSDNEIDTYTKYENHLDKKFEKTLGMLLKLKELREPKQATVI